MESSQDHLSLITLIHKYQKRKRTSSQQRELSMDRSLSNNLELDPVEIGDVDAPKRDSNNMNVVKALIAVKKQPERKAKSKLGSPVAVIDVE
jgi:hypothetical protein